MNSERLRLFVALELPANALEALVRWRMERVASDPALGGDDALRFTAPQALHVTLCFLGWQDRSAVAAIARACAVLASMPPASLWLGRALWLPPRRPRVLAVELVDPDRTLACAQNALSRALVAGGWYRPESRRFLPHVTVARVRKGARVQGVSVTDPPRIEVGAGAVTLYRSRLSSAGAIYDALQSVRLASRAAA